METNERKEAAAAELKESVIKLTISGETEQLKEILQEHTDLWTIKDWVGTISLCPITDAFPRLVIAFLQLHAGKINMRQLRCLLSLDSMSTASITMGPRRCTGPAIGIILNL
jgi:hypothetical protein